MDFNPDEYLAKNEVSNSGGFDPDAYLEKNTPLPKEQPLRDIIEPGLMGETEPVEQKLLNNTTQALTGATLPSGIAGLVKGTLGTVGKYASRFGQNQAMKAMGGAGGQIGQVGIPESREIAQMMIDKGAVSPLRGSIGMEDFVNNLHQQTGQSIGNARNLANTRGEAPQMAELLDAVNKNLTSKFASGVNKAPATLNRAKETIAQGGTGTFSGNAAKATELNNAASANKIYRPQGATSDTADIISHMNNEKMKGVLSPEEYAKYEKDLGEYGPISTAKKFMERGERKEMGGHQGGSLTKALADKTMDAFGNRMAATLGSGVGKTLQSAATTPFNPQVLAAYLTELYNKSK